MKPKAWHSVDPWRPIRIPAASLPNNVEKLRHVVTELDVERAPRYRANATQTFCNIFLTDVCDAYGVPPTHWMHEDGTPAQYGRGLEMSANRLVRWFHSKGARYGWIVADKQTAMDAAARGHLVALGWDSKTSGPGHVAVLLPEGTVAHAGRKNGVGIPIGQAFGKSRAPDYFIHAHGAHAVCKDTP